MKRSCKDIDITDWHTIEPYVWDCIMRHVSRWDFRGLVCGIGGMDREAYKEAVRIHDRAAFADAIKNISIEAANRIRDRDLKLKPVKYRTKIDNSSFKKRLIGRESAMQQVFDHICCGASEPIFKRRIVSGQVSSIKGRGQVVGTKMIERWIREDDLAAKWAKDHHVRHNRRCRYITRGVDIEQCYASGRVDIFMGLLKRDCGNADLLWLWETLLKSHRQPANGQMYEGFMIGALPSQWAMQYMMSFVYRHLMDFKVSRRGKAVKPVHKALIYMDDIFICGPNKRDLRTAILDTARYTESKLGLRLKPHWAVCRLRDTPVDMMGFVVRSDGSVSVRPRIYLRVRRLALRLLSGKGKVAGHTARRMCSYKGFFIQKRLALRVQGAIRHMHLFKLFRAAAGAVSREQRRLNRDSVFYRGTVCHTVHATA